MSYEGRIHFYSEDVDFELEEEALVKSWINQTINIEECQLKKLSYVFCSDEYLYNMNVEFLQHDTYTDIITFPYSYVPVEADMFISIDRIKENANRLNCSFDKELRRVVIHGVLHLIGYDDKNSDRKEEMRKRENKALLMFDKLRDGNVSRGT